MLTTQCASLSDGFISCTPRKSLPKHRLFHIEYRRGKVGDAINLLRLILLIIWWDRALCAVMGGRLDNHLKNSHVGLKCRTGWGLGGQ